MRIAFKTFGCKANSLDTDALFQQARLRGFELVDEEEIADAYVINSCTVTQNADKEARYTATRYKRQNPDAVVALIGCYGQVGHQELEGFNDIDVVMGTANKGKVFELLSERFAGQPVVKNQVEKAMGYLPESFPGSRHARASIKIQDGCNFSCSYCIIPQARGRSRSLPLEKVLSQIQEAYSQGFQEVVLTAVHLAHYGWDKRTHLVELLREILKTDGPRIRLSTLDPFEIPDELIDLVASEERLCPHFHIALQSGSDKVLQNMRRIYKSEEFFSVGEKIRSKISDAFVGVDVIVGFNGEGEKEFSETLSCLEKSYWTKLHVFPFSLRAGTRAESLTEAVPRKTVGERSELLRKLSAHRYQAFLNSQLGKTKEVILERTLSNSSTWLGHTENYIPVEVPGDFVRGSKINCMLGEISGERVKATFPGKSGPPHAN